MDSDSEGSVSFNLLDKGLEDVLSGHKSKELNVLYIYGDHNEVALRVFNEILDAAKFQIETTHPGFKIKLPQRVNWPKICDFDVFMGQACIERYLSLLRWSPKWTNGIRLYEIRERGFSSFYIYEVTWGVLRKNAPVNQYCLFTYFMFELCHIFPPWARVMVRIFVEGVDRIFRPYDAKLSEYFIISQIQNKYIYNELWLE